jgi:sialate O-acetylesterase
MPKNNQSIKSLLPADADVWVLAGQSNMEGCGLLAESLAPHPNVFVFGSRHKWAQAKDPLHDFINSKAAVDFVIRKSMTPPEHAKTDNDLRNYWNLRTKGRGAGLGIAFGSTLSASTGRPVGLIACAHGGTSLEQWSQLKKGEGFNSLYGAMLKRIQLAGGNLKGILWYQGESDASMEAALTYRKRFVAWVRALRKDLGQPNLPVITVQLGCVANPVHCVDSWDKMRDEQLKLSGVIDQLGVVPANDLDLSDSIHIDSPGLIRLGKRMARLALRLSENKMDISSGPIVAKISQKVRANGLGEIEMSFAGVTGSLLPLRSIQGFSVLSRNLSPHKTATICTVYRHSKKKNTLILLTTHPLRKGDFIAYGRGLKPICNLIDEADMGVCSFYNKV